MITLHHLDHSRSTRVLWLLEELGTDYRLIRHQRLPGFRAPESLAIVHPLGKAPIVEDGGLVIAESAVILSYLDERYGQGRFSPAAGTPVRIAHDEWLHYAEGSAAPSLMMTLYAKLAGGLDGVVAQIVTRDATLALDHINAAVDRNEWLLGDELTLADIQMAYLVDLAGFTGLLEGRPGLAAYATRLRQRPALQRALEIGGPMVPNSG